MDGFKKDSADPIGLSKEDLEALFESAFEGEVKGPEKKTPKYEPKTPYFEGSFSKKKSEPKIKSSLRMKYEAEVSSIKKESGNLEEIRRNLGLSKRKMAQLLLVDPSAWTRWTSKKGEAPPHIYRALQWYLLLQEKHPEYKSSLWLNAVSTPKLSEHEVQNLKAEVIAHAQERLSQDAVQFLNENAFEAETLERQLIRAKQESHRLSERIKWLIMSQFALLTMILISFLF